jgi:NADPH2:quinone reductase
MLALRAHTFDGPAGLSLDEVPERAGPERGLSVRVAVHAAGVGFVDAQLTRGQFECVTTSPVTPGLEISGEVTSAPSGCGFSVGDRVVGHVMTGGFAEVAWVRPDMLAPLPRELSFVQGAAVVVNFHTALLALSRAQLRAGESVLVHGAGGGLGSAVVAVATALGARVVGVAGSSEREDVAWAAGARDVCGPDDWSAAVSAAGGVDVVVDPVGGEVFEESLYCLAPEGRLITVGATSSVLGKAPSAQLLRRGSTVMGLLWTEALARDRTLFGRAAKQLDDLVAGGLRPIIGGTYDLAEGADALRAIENRTASGKLVLTIG